METSKDFLVGLWKHEKWSCELTMFNFLKIEWPNGSRAYGAWTLRNNEVILSYVYQGKDEKNYYIFSIEEIIDENNIKTKDVEKNVLETITRVLNWEFILMQL